MVYLNETYYLFFKRITCVGIRMVYVSGFIQSLSSYLLGGFRD